MVQDDGGGPTIMIVRRKLGWIQAGKRDPRNKRRSWHIEEGDTASTGPGSTRQSGGGGSSGRIEDSGFS